MIRRARYARRVVLATLPVLAVVFAPLTVSCSSDPNPVELGFVPDAPAVYTVGVDSSSRFSGAVSELSAETSLVATMRVTPVSPNEVEVEVTDFAASVSGSPGRGAEPAGLSIPPTAGAVLRIGFSSPGVASSVEAGNERGRSLLDARIPLISARDILRAPFAPLPEGSFRPGDTWTGDIPPAYPGLGGDPVRMRYVLDSGGEEPEVTGYELSVDQRRFSRSTAADTVSGEGHLDIDFTGTLDGSGGYSSSSRTADFDSDFLELGSGGFANGNLHMSQKIEVEKLNAFEEFGLDVASE